MRKVKNEFFNQIFTGIVLIFLLAFAYRILLPLLAQISKNGLANGDITGILAVLLAFISITAVGVYYVITKANESRLDKIFNEMAVSMHDEQISSSVGAELTTAKAMWFWYDQKRKESSEDKRDAESYLKECIRLGRSALKKVGMIKSKEKYADLICRCKNNLVFPIIHLVNPSVDERKEALMLSVDLSQFVKTNKQESTTVPLWRPAENRGLALIRFSDGDMVMEQEGRKIVGKIIADGNLLKEIRDEVISDKNIIIELLKAKAP